MTTTNITHITFISVEKIGRSKDLPTFDIWDFTHLLELAISGDTLGKILLMRSSIETLAELIVHKSHRTWLFV